jgi:hypothetical protein
MQRIQGWTEAGNTTVTIAGSAGTVSQKFQGSYLACTVTVYDAGTTDLSTIYSDDGVTPLANPFTAAASPTGDLPAGTPSGVWFFYAANGRYDVKFSGGGIPTPFTLGDFIAYDYTD